MNMAGPSPCKGRARVTQGCPAASDAFNVLISNTYLYWAARMQGLQGFLYYMRARLSVHTRIRASAFNNANPCNRCESAVFRRSFLALTLARPLRMQGSKSCDVRRAHQPVEGYGRIALRLEGCHRGIDRNSVFQYRIDV